MALTGGKDGTLRLWDLEKGTPYGPAIPSHSGMVSTVVLGTLAGEPAFVSGGTDGTVRIWRYPDPGCRSTICIGSSVNRIVVADDIIALACDAGVMALQVS